MKYSLKNLNSTPKTWKRVVLVLALVSVVSYIAFMGAYFATSEPSFCASCHQITKYVDSWRKSPHKGVKCLYCHEFRGFLGKLHSKSRGLNYVYQQLTGQFSIFIKAQVFEQNCIACHLDDYWNYPGVTRLDIKHYGLIKTNRSCLQCHRDIGHEVNMFSSEKFGK